MLLSGTSFSPGHEPDNDGHSTGPDGFILCWATPVLNSWRLLQAMDDKRHPRYVTQRVFQEDLIYRKPH